MSDNGEIPEFKAEYLKAFLCLMLFKLGGSQTITLELLEKFPAKKGGLLPPIWESKSETFTLKLPRKRRKGIIKPSKKIIIARN